VTAIAVTLLGALVSVRLALVAGRAPVADRARRLRARRRLRMPPAFRDRLTAALARADVDLAPDDAMRLWLLATIVLAGLGAVLTTVAALPFALAGLAGGPAALWWSRHRGDARAAAALPGALDRVAAGLRAGTTVGESLHALGAGPGPLGPDLRRLDARRSLGVGLSDALSAWARERPVAGVRAVTGALALAIEVGGACALALEGLGESLRARDAATKEARALSAQARVSAVVVGSAPLAYLAFASAADPGSLDLLLGTGAGRTCLVAGLVLEGLGAWWMHVLLRGEP
jgi:tight adherence protein B